MQVPAGTTPRSLWGRLELAGTGPGGDGLSRDTGWPAGLRVAINQHFAAPDTPLADGDELAFLPPISSG